MRRTDGIRIRHNQAITAAAVIAFVGALPLAGARWYLTPVLLVPLLVGAWAWRAGTDADPIGVRIRALLRDRRIPWTAIAELVPDPRGRVVARLTSGRTVPLPAVRVADLPRLVAASGRPLLDGEPAAQADPPPPTAADQRSTSADQRSTDQRSTSADQRPAADQ